MARGVMSLDSLPRNPTLEEAPGPVKLAGPGVFLGRRAHWPPGPRRHTLVAVVEAMSQATRDSLKPDLVVDLDWQGDNRLRCRTAGVEIVLDSPPSAGPNPVQAMAAALAACMAMDVLLVIQRGRFKLEALTANLIAERAPDDPRRILKVDLRFVIKGQIPADRIERAIQLSRDKYCSVWHSMREDIALTTSFELQP
ncbi:MAG TPA: OsmC family protein [Vicinamibacteria bacterium]